MFSDRGLHPLLVGGQSPKTLLESSFPNVPSVLNIYKPNVQKISFNSEKM